MSERYSTEYLNKQIEGWDPSMRNGTARAAYYLLRIDDEEARAMIDNEAHVKTNVNGGIYSHNVGSLVDRYLSGDHSFPYWEANVAMLERERAERDRTGVFRPESMTRAFSGLPHR